MACEALFHSPCFLYAFLPLVVIVFWLLPVYHARLMWLTVASYVFYSFWDVRFAALLLASSLVDFFVAQRLGRALDERHRKAWLVASVAFNLGLLGVFKYAMFARDSAQQLLETIGLGPRLDLPMFEIVLPVGISFYTFQTMSYTIDVYRGDVQATNRLGKYLAYVALFPQLVAGPIVRYRDVQRQYDGWPRWPSVAMLMAGVALFGAGLGKKVLFADPIAHVIDPWWSLSYLLDGVQAWLAAIGFTLQLYFDFSGYSDMAIGLGLLMGLRYPRNFDAPYQATDPTDFWRRWHISLSTWLRDYLYVPLGGNRKGVDRMRLNLLLVMVLGGLWHGSAWTFVWWGAFHGVLLVLHREVKGPWNALPLPLQRAVMLLLVVIGWVMFRADDMTAAGEVYRAMLRFGDWSGYAAYGWELAWFAVLLVITQIGRPLTVERFRFRARTAIVTGASLALALLLLRAGTDIPFLYYQF